MIPGQNCAVVCFCPLFCSICDTFTCLLISVYLNFVSSAFRFACSYAFSCFCIASTIKKILKQTLANLLNLFGDSTTPTHDTTSTFSPEHGWFYYSPEQQADDSQMEESTLHTITPEMVFAEEQAMRQQKNNSKVYV